MVTPWGGIFLQPDGGPGTEESGFLDWRGGVLVAVEILEMRQGKGFVTTEDTEGTEKSGGGNREIARRNPRPTRDPRLG